MSHDRSQPPDADTPHVSRSVTANRCRHTTFGLDAQLVFVRLGGGQGLAMAGRTRGSGFVLGIVIRVASAVW